MRGRIRIAAAGLASLAIIALSVGTAGAQTPSTYSVTANGGFLSLSLLNNAVQVTGGGSAADAGTATPAGVATSGPYADASGTGLCASLSSTALCPSDATTPLPSGVLLDSTARSNATSTNPTPAAGSACILPLNLGLINVDIGCGTSSASVDTSTTSGSPAANGDGNLGTVTVTLGDIPGLGGLLNGGSLGALCPAATSSSSVGSASAPAPLSIVSSLLGTVNNLLSTSNLPLLPSTIANGTTSPLGGVCSILNGLLGTGSVVGSLPVLGGLLSNANASTPLLSIVLGDSDSNVSTSTSSGDAVVTSTATTKAVDVNILNMLDVQVLPNSASIAVDTVNGNVSIPSPPTVGLLKVTAGSAAPLSLNLSDLNATLGSVLNTLGAAVGQVLNAVAAPNLIEVAPASTTIAPNGQSGSAEAADLKLSLLGGLVVLNLGDAKVTAAFNPAGASPSTSSAVVQTAAATTPVAATPVPVVPAAGVVPNVTTVHTGEFWSGTLAPFVGGAMALAGLALIARRRLFSVARSVAVRHRR
jgi:hypothetical protein